MRRRPKRGANWPNGGGKPFQGGMQEGPLFNGVPGDPATLVDGGVPELPVTDLIKQEAAKHIQKPDLPRLKPRKGKKLRKIIKDLKQKRRKLRKLLKEGVQISDGSGADLTVTEQIQKEAAKDVGALAFPKKSKGKDKLFKEKLQRKKKKKFGKFPKFPKESIQISDGSGSDLTVTEQIKQEAGRHVGAKVFPNKLNKKEKRRQKRMNKGKKVKQDVHWPWQP